MIQGDDLARDVARSGSRSRATDPACIRSAAPTRGAAQPRGRKSLDFTVLVLALGIAAIYYAPKLARFDTEQSFSPEFLKLIEIERSKLAGIEEKIKAADNVVSSVRGEIVASLNRAGFSWRSEDGEISLNDIALTADGKTAIAVGKIRTVTSSGKSEEEIRLEFSNNQLFDAFQQGIVTSPIPLISKGLRDDFMAAVGDRRRVGDVQGTLLAQIASMEKIGISRPKEAPQEPKTPGGNKDKIKSSENSSILRFLLQTNALRAGIILLILFLVQILVSLSRYDTRLAAFYDARADALLLTDPGSLPQRTLNVDEIDKLMAALSPDALDFGRAPRTVTEQAGQMARDLFRMGGRGGTSAGG